MTDNSPTPRTDKAAAMNVGNTTALYVFADFARQLERELAQAQADVIEMRNERKESDTRWAEQVERAQAEAARNAKDAERYRELRRVDNHYLDVYPRDDMDHIIAGDTLDRIIDAEISQRKQLNQLSERNDK